MTKPSATGNVLTRTASDLEEVALRHSARLTELMTHLLDGNTNDALRIAVELKDENSKVLRILGMLIHKRLSEAETAAMALAATDRQAV